MRYVIVSVLGIATMVLCVLFAKAAPPDLQVEQHHNDLYVRGKVRGLGAPAIIHPQVSAGTDGVILGYFVVANIDKPCEALVLVDVTWRVPNAKKDEVTMTVKELGVLWLSTKELRTLLDDAKKEHPQAANK